MLIDRRALLIGSALSVVATTRVCGKSFDLPDFWPHPTINGAGLGQVEIDIPARFNLPTGPAVWVAEDGNDSNPGTFYAPLASLRTAFDQPDAVAVLCKPGRYHAQLAVYGTTKTLAAPFGEATLYSENRDGYVANEGGTLGIGAGITLVGVAVQARPWKGRAPLTILRGCKIISSPTNGLMSNGGESFSSNVLVQSSRYDCFNYSWDGRPNFAIEHNCHAVGAGDPETFGRVNPDGSERVSFNGSSSHGCSVVRYGGLYEGSLGPDIVDTWDSTQAGQISLNYGVLVRGSKCGIGFQFFGGTGAPTALLDSCGSEGQSIDLLIDHGAWANTLNSMLKNVVTSSGGRLEHRELTTALLGRRS